MTSTIDERELFSRHYQDVEPEALWSAVKGALATMDMSHADEAARSARFSSGVSLTSWGEHMLALISGAGPAGSVLSVRVRAKGSFLTTKWGEDLHARGVEEQLVRAIDAALTRAARPHAEPIRELTRRGAWKRRAAAV